VHRAVWYIPPAPRDEAAAAVEEAAKKADELRAALGDG
jgi:hypothetical protein